MLLQLQKRTKLDPALRMLLFVLWSFFPAGVSLIKASRSFSDDPSFERFAEPVKIGQSSWTIYLFQQN